MIFGFFKSNPLREARQLNKDAAAVVDLARGTYREQLLRDIARLTRDGIAQLEDVAGDDARRREREIDRFKVLHRESRRRNDQAGLTAYTLIIIHARSLPLGEPAEPARAVIREFLAEWPAEQGPERVLAG